MVKTPNNLFLYVGGAFSAVNGVPRKNIVRIRLSDGAITPLFKWSGGVVSDLQFSNGRLFVAGNFQEKLLALRPITGVNTGFIDLKVTDSLSGWVPKVDKIAINPSGTNLVAIGDFRRVNGYARRAAFRLSLGSITAVLTNWHPARFGVACKPTVPYYLRDVAWSPDGSYFVIVSSGGPYGGYPETGFCDGAGRWEASSSGRTAEPTWINWTGGDSLYSVAIGASAIYVGGHQRWLDNPQGHDSAGPGAYPVDSLGVIDPKTGLANRTWNARPMTRDHGKEGLTLYSGGLVVSGDGSVIAGSYHRGTAVFPYCDKYGQECP
jgi:WD40 repeat protein